MTLKRLRLRNLLFHWRGNLAVFLGVVVGTAVLTGALLVGDSLRGSLRAAHPATTGLGRGSVDRAAILSTRVGRRSGAQRGGRARQSGPNAARHDRGARQGK